MPSNNPFAALSASEDSDDDSVPVTQTKAVKKAPAKQAAAKPKGDKPVHRDNDRGESRATDQGYDGDTRGRGGRAGAGRGGGRGGRGRGGAAAAVVDVATTANAITAARTLVLPGSKKRKVATAAATGARTRKTSVLLMPGMPPRLPPRATNPKTAAMRRPTTKRRKTRSRRSSTAWLSTRP